jgi:hypothetical protein
MKYAVVAVALLLAGCTTTKVVSSNANTIVVKASLKKPAEAQMVADTECSKYKKTAQLNQYVPANIAWANYFFNCR